MNLLIGDIGGTHTRLRVLCAAADGWHVVHEMRRRSADFASLGEAVTSGLEALSPHERGGIAGACLAVAGPVSNGRVHLTNRPWETDESALAAELGLPAVRLINDLEALAHGIDTLPREAFIPVRAGPVTGPRSLVIAAGTGLGMTLRQTHADGTRVFDSEGGHVDFAPADEEQVTLLRALGARHGHVSYERILSGDGLVAVHDFVCRRSGCAADPAIVAAADTAAAITALANEGGAHCADAAARLFVRILGAFAGNAAMQWLATGGVYLAGGVLTHLQSHLLSDDFAQAFTGKGRMQRLLAPVPVWLLQEPDAGLAGALRVAESLWPPPQSVSSTARCPEVAAPVAGALP